MSAKRVATTDLNHENWDQDDPSDEQEIGTYETAPKEVLEKRVIKTARRRTQMSGVNEVKKSVFSGFGGFNKSQPSSFDFLAKLTDSNKTNGTSSATKNENTVSSSIFTNSSLVSKASSGLFSSSVSNTSPKTTSAFGTATTPSIFGISSSSTTGATNTSPFTASKADSTVVDSPFNMTSSSSKPQSGGLQLKSSPILIPTTTNKPLFSSSTNSSGSTLFKIHPVSSTTSTNTLGADSKISESKTETASDAKMAYYSKLKGLNESVSDWIKKHVAETPLCILTPIFNDYEKYLKEIQEEFSNAEDDHSKKDQEKTISRAPFSSNLTASPKTTSSLFSSTSSGSNSFFAPKAAPVVSEEKTSQPFSFGIKTTDPSTAATDGNISGFSFGIKPETKATSDQLAKLPFDAEKPTTLQIAVEKAGASPFGPDKPATSPFGSEKSKSSLFTSENSAATPFSLSSQKGSGGTTPAPFSFGIGQKFSFSPNTQLKPENTNEQKNENEDEDEPPKVEFTPVVEENSVFDKRCKVFVKKDGNFADKGVATLYIKTIENSSKHQLLVRANTNLGNVLVNLVLASAIPTQRMGKNNVMMVCIPTPDAKPPPTPVLIRVKTSEEADELLETLNKYKA